MTDRDWKQAKPKWVVDAAMDEMASLRQTLALRWPQEAEPKAAFGFGDYDHDWGKVECGEYWVCNGRGVERTFLREKLASEIGWKKLRFSQDGIKWTDSVTRGHYFLTERDAALRSLWIACRDHALELKRYWQRYEDAT